MFSKICHALLKMHLLCVKEKGTKCRAKAFLVRDWNDTYNEAT